MHYASEHWHQSNGCAGWKKAAKQEESVKNIINKIIFKVLQTNRDHWAKQDIAVQQGS